ncbi:thioredoxin, mitochondrial-like [Saccoglossus kowalevskii]|uniref:Thioredoxin, mitochondrial-like n=1 Tax=Saccoglossus kowalevskii TaxID=10224 RepID=A0ABM0GML0_SACKO|nr:PREDICTED: thioredoxin, mitochondrial-like [Saccoglossus kowalevskii]
MMLLSLRRIASPSILQSIRNLQSSYLIQRNVPAASRCAFIHTGNPHRTSFNVQDSDDFMERVIKSNKPTVVDFHATWCGPCKILGPRLEKVIAAQNGKVQLAKVDVDTNTDLAMEYGVSAVPMVIAVKQGEKVDEFIGLQEEDQLNSFVEKLL